MPDPFFLDKKPAPMKAVKIQSQLVALGKFSISVYYAGLINNVSTRHFSSKYPSGVREQCPTFFLQTDEDQLQ